MLPPRPARRIMLNLAIDSGLAALAAPLARWVADPAAGWLHPFWFLAGGAITLSLGGLPFRLSQQYWRFAGLSDLLSVGGGSLVSAGLFSLMLRLAGFPLPSRSFPLIHWLILFVILGAPRAFYRQYGRRGGRAEHTRTVVLVGADEGADLFLRAAGQGQGGGARFRVLGLLALSARQTGRRIQGAPILGTVDDAAAILARLRRRGRLPAVLVLTDAEWAGPRLAALLDAAHQEGVSVARAPRPTALHDATRDDPTALRPVAIEELLNRPQARLDRDGMARLIRGRRVLVTGAGGTIGAELARQVAALAPAELLLVDNGEYALWQIDLEIAEIAPDLPRRARIADVRDAARIAAIFADARPELVFHAAALKHVPMVEANGIEGLLTNVIGTRNVADAARATGAAAMVLISTDKAVNPSSLMGATKRLAEMYCQALDLASLDQAAAGLRCVTVRFGNVLGSTGSVVPLFRRQLERGGPLTVTHPEMRRYFMTVREAVGLVLQACVAGLDHTMAERGFTGSVFVLDMGDPVRILDLARQMIHLAGLQPDRDIEIRFTGLRPGEKLSEELFHGREPPLPTSFPGLLMAAPRTGEAAFVAHAIDAIEAACRTGDLPRALDVLGGLVPEFRSAAMGAALPEPVVS